MDTTITLQEFRELPLEFLYDFIKHINVSGLSESEQKAVRDYTVELIRDRKLMKIMEPLVKEFIEEMEGK